MLPEEAQSHLHLFGPIVATVNADRIDELIGVAEADESIDAGRIKEEIQLLRRLVAQLGIAGPRPVAQGVPRLHEEVRLDRLPAPDRLQVEALDQVAAEAPPIVVAERVRRPALRLV